MSDQKTKATASRVRNILRKLGVERYSVGTTWNSAGDRVVVVDVPPGVDREPVAKKLSREVGTDVEVRQISRSIIAQ